MRKTAKGAATLAISAILAAGTLAGCDSKSADGTAPDPENSKTSEIMGGEAADPDESHERVRLTWWMKLDANVSTTYPSPGDTPWVKYVQEKTGIRPEFIHPTTGSEIEEFSILVASGEYPDITEYIWTICSGGPQAAINDGVILSLTDVMTENAPNFTKLVQEHPSVDKIVRSANGDYYCFPFLRGLGSPNPTQFSVSIVLCENILDELGLEMLETIGEWDTVLRACGGYGFEVPFATRKEWMKDAWSSGFDNWDDFYIEDGVMKSGLIEGSRKAFVAKMRDWYGKGLIDRNWLVADKSFNQTYFTTGRTTSVYVPFGQGLGQYIRIVHGADPEITEEDIRLAAPVTPTKGQNAKFFEMNNIYNKSDVSAAISTQCENAAAVAWLLDWMCSEEGDLYCSFGIEGEAYETKDGKPVYTDLITNNSGGLFVTSALTAHTRAPSSNVCIQDEAYTGQYYELGNRKEALELSTRTNMDEHFFPPISVAEEDSKQYADTMNNVEALAEEMGAQLIAGTMSMDERDKHQQQLRDFGIGDAIAMIQTVYDAYMAD